CPLLRNGWVAVGNGERSGSPQQRKRSSPLSTALRQTRFSFHGRRRRLDAMIAGLAKFPGVNGLFILNRSGNGAGAIGRKGEISVLVARLHRAIHEMQQGDLCAAQGEPRSLGFDGVFDPAAAEGQSLGQDALLAPRQNLFERRKLEPQRTMGVFKVLRRNHEFGVEACDELRKERLGLLDRGDVAQPHLLDQAILQGLIGALDTPLGLRRQRANLLDAQALGHAVELGLAVAAQSFFGVDAKDAKTIRVERQRRPIRQEMAAQRDEIGLRRLRRRHVQRGQTPRRVVDEHDQGAARRPALEPVVLAAVDLNELAEPWPPLAQQERPPRLARLRLPKAKSDLKPPYALTRDRDPLDLGELFGGQGRAKAGVLAAQKPFDPFTDARPEPPQRNPPTLLGDKPGVALPPIGANQPFHLPNANPQPLARRASAESLCNHKSNNMRALTFSPLIPKISSPNPAPFPNRPKRGHSHVAQRGHSHVAVTSVSARLHSGLRGITVMGWTAPRTASAC